MSISDPTEGDNVAKPVTAAFYEARAEQHRSMHDQLAKRSLRISNLRGLAFVIFATAGGFALLGSGGALALALSTLGLAGFVGLVIYHAKVIDQQQLEQRWTQVNRDAAARVANDGWHDLPNRGEAFRDKDHAYADDLDLIGRLQKRHSIANGARCTSPAIPSNHNATTSGTSRPIARHDNCRPP